MSDLRFSPFEHGDFRYQVVVFDDADVELDPTFLLFRGPKGALWFEEQAIATVHLDPRAVNSCTDEDHVIARAPEET